MRYTASLIFIFIKNTLKNIIQKVIIFLILVMLFFNFINNINYNKNTNIYSTNDKKFNIHTINYNKNNNIYQMMIITQIIIFFISII